MRTASGDTGDHSLDAARLPGPAVREEAIRVAVGADVGVTGGGPLTSGRTGESTDRVVELEKLGKRRP